MTKQVDDPTPMPDPRLRRRATPAWDAGQTSATDEQVGVPQQDDQSATGAAPRAPTACAPQPRYRAAAGGLTSWQSSGTGSRPSRPGGASCTGVEIELVESLDKLSRLLRGRGPKAWSVRDVAGTTRGTWPRSATPGGLCGRRAPVELRLTARRFLYGLTRCRVTTFAEQTHDNPLACGVTGRQTGGLGQRHVAV